MYDALLAFGFLMPVIMEVLVACLIALFIWGLVQPAKRQVLLPVFWALVGLAVVFDLTYLYIIFLMPRP